MKLDVKKELYVFPVYAGVILKDTTGNTSHRGVPRVCGGDPVFSFSIRFINMCSPCMRG